LKTNHHFQSPAEFTQTNRPIEEKESICPGGTIFVCFDFEDLFHVFVDPLRIIIILLCLICNSFGFALSDPFSDLTLSFLILPHLVLS
jgi:hypothetical protein